MALNRLLTCFRSLNIFEAEVNNRIYFSTQRINVSKNLSLILSQEKIFPNLVRQDIVLKQKCINLQFTNQINRLTKNKIIECPTQSKFVIEDPIKQNIVEVDIVPNKIIEIPKKINIEKQAVRLIVIRRKKIKKHKRKKFLKKMRAIIEKQEVRKKQLKKKMFEAELKVMTLKAVKFSAKNYVEQRIELLKRIRLPNKYRGEYLPEEMILKFMKEKERQKTHKQRLHNYRLKLE